MKLVFFLAFTIISTFSSHAASFGVGSKLILKKNLEVHSGDFLNLEPFDYGSDAKCGLWVHEMSNENRTIPAGTVLVVHHAKRGVTGRIFHWEAYSNIDMHIENDPGVPDLGRRYSIDMSVSCETLSIYSTQSKALKQIPELLKSLKFYSDYFVLL